MATTLALHCGGCHPGVSVGRTRPSGHGHRVFFREADCQGTGHSQWRGGKGSEKDLYCIGDPSLSIEIKSSGQLGYRVYGNRSYGQQVVNVGAAKKDKSGYYITINFHAQALTRLRFGWIDADDWQAQKAATGQMAGLGDEVYRHKLETIPGRYLLEGPVQLVEGVGAKAADELHSLGIQTIAQLLNAQVLLPRHERLRAGACEQYRGLY